MAWVETTAPEFEALLLRQLQEDTETARLVALETAQRALHRAVKGTNEAGAVDRGQFKRSWIAARTFDGAELRNDAPYAGVIEYGRRPGKPGPPLAPIYEWVQRKLRGNIKAQFKVVRSLSLAGVAMGPGTRKAKAAARRDIKAQFGSGDRAVDAAAWGIAMKIRDKIHAKGTKPRFILRKVAATMGDDYQQAAVRVLRRKHGNG